MTSNHRPERRGHPRVPMAKRVLLRVGPPRAIRDTLYSATVVDMSCGGLFCAGKLPQATEGTEAVAFITVRTRFGNRELRLPAVIVRLENGKETEEVHEMALRFKAGRGLTPRRLRSFLDRARQEYGKLIASQGLLSPIAESLRMLRVSLGPSSGGAPRVILVTSAAPGEGKSFIASHFAVLLAREGKRVLLVDTDLRRPSLHTTFDLHPAPGIAQFISNGLDRPLSELAQPTAAGIELIPAGELDIHTGEGWDHASVSALTERLRSTSYEYIVLDTPPVLVAASTCLLAKKADDVLLVIRSGSSRERDVKQARTLLDRGGASLRGVILNDQPEYARPSYIADYYKVRVSKPSTGSERHHSDRGSRGAP